MILLSWCIWRFNFFSQAFKSHFLSTCFSLPSILEFESLVSYTLGPPTLLAGELSATLQYHHSACGGARGFQQGFGQRRTRDAKWAVMEDINRRYCFDIDICQRGNVSDKVALKEVEVKEEVRTFQSPQRTAQYKHERWTTRGRRNNSRILIRCSFNLHFIRLQSAARLTLEAPSNTNSRPYFINRIINIIIITKTLKLPAVYFYFKEELAQDALVPPHKVLTCAEISLCQCFLWIVTSLHTCSGFTR